MLLCARQLERDAAEVTRHARTVFVSQLVARATGQQVAEYFEAVGKVKDVRLITDKHSGRSKGFGYVEFAELESVPMAMLLNGRKFCMKHPGCTCSGLPILIKSSEAEKNFQAAAESSTAVNDKRVYAGNLAPNAGSHLRDLRAMFSAHGPVERLDFRETHALVTFKSKESALLALEGLHGVTFLEQPLRVGMPNGLGFVVAANGDQWPMERDTSGLNAAHQAELVARLQQTTSQQARQLGANMGMTSTDARQAGMYGGIMNPLAPQPPQPQPPQMPMAPAPVVPSMPAGVPGMPAGVPGMPAGLAGVAGIAGLVVPPGVAAPAPPAGVGAAAGVAGAAAGAGGAAPPSGTPSQYLLLKNMFDATKEDDEDWDKDLQEDVEEECQKFGAVSRTVVDTSSGAAGHIYVQFECVFVACVVCPYTCTCL